MNASSSQKTKSVMRSPAKTAPSALPGVEHRGGVLDAVVLVLAQVERVHVADERREVEQPAEEQAQPVHPQGHERVAEEAHVSTSCPTWSRSMNSAPTTRHQERARPCGPVPG